MSSRLLVANVIEEARWGGPQARIAQVADRLRDMGVDTVVVSARRDNQVFRQRLEELRLPAVYAPLNRMTSHGPALVRHVLGFGPEVFILAKILRRLRAEIVHANGLWQVKAVLAGRLAGKKVVWHLNDTYAPHVVRRGLGILTGLAHGFIMSSRRTLKYYSGLPGLSRKPVRVIQAPVDTAKFDPRTVVPDPAMQRAPGLKILTTANLNPAKGLEFFLDMASRLRASGLRASYFICGARLDSQAAYADSLFRLVKQQRLEGLVHFLGARRDIPSLLAATDIYVCSSRFESSPMSLWEALSMGLPVVASDVGDAPRFVRHEQSGLVVPPGEGSALAAAMARLANDPDLARRLGNRARQVAVSELDVSLAAAGHRDFYQSIAGRS